MSWLFSRALVEEYLGVNSSGGEPSAPLSVMPTPHKFSRNDKTMEPCQLSRFGLTCAVLTECHGEELLTLYRAAFPVRTFRPPGKAQASRVSDLGSGKSLQGSFAKWDRSLSLWRIPQGSLLEAYTEFSETWPKWGMTRNGAAYRLPTPSGLMEHRHWITSGNESGLSLPTPTASTGGSEGDRPGRKNGPKLATAVSRMPTPCSMEPVKNLESSDKKRARPRSERGGGNGENLATVVSRCPTPRGLDGAKGAVSATDTTARRVIEGTANLAEWTQETMRVPTPHGFSKDGKSNGPSGNELGRAVNHLERRKAIPRKSPPAWVPCNCCEEFLCSIHDMHAFECPCLEIDEMDFDPYSEGGLVMGPNVVPTATVNDSKNSNPPSQAKRNSPPLNSVVGGSLNPPWVEWLMGWPIGWTDLRPLEMDKFQQWCRSHGQY